MFLNAKRIFPASAAVDDIQRDLAATQRILDQIRRGRASEELFEGCERLLTRAAAQAKALIPDEIRIKLAEGSILVNEHPIPLTRQEFTIVLALAAQRHQFTSRQTLLLFLYGDSEEDSSNSRIVTVLISSVRSKLRDAIGRDMIAHVPEKGFCLRDSFHEVAPAAPPARWVLDDGHIEALISSVGPEDSLAQDHNT